MNFAYPHILYLLLLVPALFGLYFWARTRRRAKLRKYGRPEVLASLMPDASPYTPWIKISLELLAVALLVVAFARPRYGEKEQQETTNGIEVMIALDVSRSMNASSTDDPNGISRLNRAKFLLGKMVDAMDNDRVGLIVFAYHDRLRFGKNVHQRYQYRYGLDPGNRYRQRHRQGNELILTRRRYQPCDHSNNRW